MAKLKKEWEELKRKKRYTQTISVTLSRQILDKWEKFSEKGFENRSAFIEFAMESFMNEILEAEAKKKEMEKPIEKGKKTNRKKKWKIKLKE